MTSVVFLQLFEQYEPGKRYSIERTLANGLCERGICVPFTVHEKMLREAEQKAKEEAEKKAKEEAEKKAELLKAKESEKTEKADSKKLNKAEKSIKK